jgi:hypothetical protein
MVSNVRASIGVGLLLGLTLSLLMWVSASPAQAQTAENCQGTIDALKLETDESADFTGKSADKDRLGLLDKLDSASEKLEQGKTEDAVRNLESFRDKVIDLANQGKLEREDADRLIAAASAAIACIAPEEPSPTTA